MDDRPAVRGAHALPTSPFMLLAGSVVLGGGVTTLILTHHRLWAGVAALFAAAALIVGTLLAREDPARRSTFAERMADRVFDGCVLAPLAWVYRPIDHSIAILALVGLGLAFLASYERAKGQSLGYRASEGFEYRAARVGVLVLALLTGWLLAGLWAFAALAGAAAGVRAWNVVLQERRTAMGPPEVVDARSEGKSP